MNIEKERAPELIDKLKKYLSCIAKTVKMEEETGLPFNEAFDELWDTNDEYRKLSDESTALQCDINRILIDTKGYPLMLPMEWTNLLNTISDHLHGNITEKEIIAHLEITLLARKENIAKRYTDVQNLFLSTDMHKRMRDLYYEAIHCYIEGSFNAVCVLCRSISELIAKQYIEHRGEGDLLVDKEKDKKVLTIPGILSKLSVPVNIIEKYRKIHTQADFILHDISGKAPQQNALGTIKLLQEFIKQFPKCL